MNYEPPQWAAFTFLCARNLFFEKNVQSEHWIFVLVLPDKKVSVDLKSCISILLLKGVCEEKVYSTPLCPVLASLRKTHGRALDFRPFRPTALTARRSVPNTSDCRQARCEAGGVVRVVRHWQPGGQSGRSKTPKIQSSDTRPPGNSQGSYPKWESGFPMVNHEVPTVSAKILWERGSFSQNYYGK